VNTAPARAYSAWSLIQGTVLANLETGEKQSGTWALELTNAEILTVVHSINWSLNDLWNR
jgi:hypothetical protein